LIWWLAVLVAPFFLVAIALAALAIKLDDRGPVLFIQPRMGFRGQHFEMIKLRTMKVGADKDGSSTPLTMIRASPCRARLAQVPH
jgi:lipopolysaccharide/colanic/teichoic acid biosynthesis glycosyltransferase